MCDYDSGDSNIDLYDIPEFPGYKQVQGCESDLHASIKEAKQCSSELETDSENDVVFILSKPSVAAPRPVVSMINKTAHKIQVVSQHVINFGQPNPPAIYKGSPHTSALPTRSTQRVTKEARAHCEQTLLREIIANPRRRKERAAALDQLQKQAAKLDLDSAQAPFRISELHSLAQRVALHTENTASELFARYFRQTSRRYARSFANTLGRGSRTKAAEDVLQPLSVNLGSPQSLRRLPVGGKLIKEVKPVIQKARAVQEKLQRLHHAVNSGTAITQAQYEPIRHQIKQLAQTLGFDQEVELAKFDFLYNRRSSVITQLLTEILNMNFNSLFGVVEEVPEETNQYSTYPILKPLELTEHCHHYQRVSEIPWDIQKYWQQRHSIFSKYDEGICMTDDAWFGVTPEPVANQVASDLASTTSSSKTTLIDLFAGAGGNTIAFALSGRWKTIIAIERDASVLACAQHNAVIYGVFDMITWIHNDCFSYVPKSSDLDPSATVIFASPPWGGPGYRTDEIFNLATMQPYSLNQIHSICTTMDCALYLPRTSDLRQIAKVAPSGKKIEVVQYCMEGASKALVAYIPAASE